MIGKTKLRISIGKWKKDIQMVHPNSMTLDSPDLQLNHSLETFTERASFGDVFFASENMALPNDSRNYVIDSITEQTLMPFPSVGCEGTSVVSNATLIQDLPLEMRFNDSHVIRIVGYALLMVMSAIGNISLLRSLAKRRHNSPMSRVNLLLQHLAVADLLVTFLLMPLEIGWATTVRWRAGDVMCRVMAFFRTFGVFLSGFLLTVISLDRYSAVLCPLTVTSARRRLRKLILAAWVMAAVCSLPQAIIFHVEKHPQHTWFEQCVTFNAFPDPKYELAYNLAGTVFMYLGPLLTIVFCYGAIILRIYGVGVGQEPVVLGRPRTRTLLMTSVIVIVFFLCWTPYNVMSLWYFIDSSSAQKVDPRIQASLFIFAVANSTVNPLVYGYFRSRRAGSNSTPGNSKLSKRIVIVYRAPFRQYFRRCTGGQSSSSDPNNFPLPRCTFESPPPPYTLGNHAITPVGCQMYDNSSHVAERRSSAYQTVPRYPVKSPSNPQIRALCSARYPLSPFTGKSPTDDPYDESPFVIQLGALGNAGTKAVPE